MCGFLFSKILCIYSAVLGLHCCAGAFSGCGEQGLLSSWGAQASPVAEHGLWGKRASAVAAQELSRPWQYGIFLDKPVSPAGGFLTA